MKRLALVLAVLAVAGSANAATFSYRPPGELVTGSGKGRVDTKVYAPGIRFPIESAPAYLNSQVWGHGGSSGPGGSQCDVANFSYPWHDNYCESRSWTMPLCPSGTGHQGQDIRAANCTRGVHKAVAVDDGTVTNIGTYSVYLTRADGTRFDYLHMEKVAVKVGQKVTRGTLMGYVSNQFGGTPTTVHLHFNMQQNVAGTGVVYVPPYLSLIQSYQKLPGVLPADAGVDAVVVDGSKDTSVADAADDTSLEEDAPPIGIPDAEEEDVGSASTPADAPSDEGGCGCRTAPGQHSGAGLGLGFLALLLSVRRRR